MVVSLFLAKALGLYFLIVGLGLVLNMSQMKVMMSEILKDRALLFVTGFMALIIGILMVISHNIWLMDWRVVITVTAWLSLFKGIALIMFPQKAIEINQKFITNDKLYYTMSVIVVLIGVFLSYHGFF